MIASVQPPPGSRLNSKTAPAPAGAPPSTVVPYRLPVGSAINAAWGESPSGLFVKLWITRSTGPEAKLIWVNIRTSKARIVSPIRSDLDLDLEHIAVVSFSSKAALAL